MGNETKLTAPRSRGGKASIPSESMIQGLKFPSQNPNPREEKGETRKEEKKAHGRAAACVFLRQGKEKNREGGKERR